jgi:succinoglycan biosynthesis protein ExoO
MTMAHYPQPRVSVLIPAYDVGDVLPRAVRSVLNQTLQDLEVLVIDDASTDGTYATATALAANDGRVRVLRAARNGGPGAARSLGLNAARGDWIAILDADDVFHPDRLARLVGAAEAGDLDAVADNLELIDPGTGDVIARAFPMDDAETEAITPMRFLANSIPAGRINIGWMQPVVRRAFLARHAIAWRDLRHAEDLVYAMEILLSGARFSLFGWVGYAYTQRRGAVSGAFSPHSRTRRSAAEQHRALDVLLRLKDEVMSPAIHARISQLHVEITVAANLLDARDAAAEGRWAKAAASALAAAAAPRSLCSCLLARYGPSARRLR